jgi:hypothetical protein
VGYPTTAELVAASNVDALTSLDPDVQDGYRASAITSVEDFCRQTFEAEGTELDPVIRVVDGNGEDTIYLPKRLATLATVAIAGEIVAEGDVALSESGEVLTLADPVSQGSWVTRVRRTSIDDGPAFTAGRQNVAVAGVWGWTDDEWTAGRLEPVATAIRFDMEDQAQADASQIADTVRSYRALGLSTISQGGLSASIKTSEPVISIRAQRQLARFRWRAARPVSA